MKSSFHALKRMNQRGINREMVELVLLYGKVKQDKTVLGRKEALQLLATLQRQVVIAKKIVDKGGVVVVTDTDNDVVITTYNYKV